MVSSAFCLHPLSLCLMLIMLAVRVCVSRGLIFMKWISYAIILIFLGGIIVIFIYVTTLAGNEKFFLNRPSLLNLIIFLSFITIVSSLTIHSQFKKEAFIRHIYYSSSLIILWFLIIFLFSTLIVIVKMSESFKGALIKFI
jgi:NADH-ubiquinone oxidoreductase chain 6